MIDSQTLDLVVVASVLVVGVVAVFVYLTRRLRRRRDQILTELKDKPELVQDRAFNRLAMARREAAVIGRTGSDISRAQALIAQSQSAFDLRQYPRAYELAQSAHESLVTTHQAPATQPPSSEFRGPPIGPPAGLPTLPRSVPEAGPATAPLPRNRAESHFQLGLLDQDLETARKEHPTAGTTLAAEALRNQARDAFDRADYTEAFRLALRARRGLGGRVESLVAPPTDRPLASGGVAVDPEGTAEQVAGGERCPNCGYPTVAADVFCRGCGTPHKPSACPTCGTTRSPSDTFCGRCGTRFGP